METYQNSGGGGAQDAELEKDRNYLHCFDINT